MENRLFSIHTKLSMKIVFDLLIFMLIFTNIFSFSYYRLAETLLYKLKFALFILLFSWALFSVLVSKKTLLLSKYVKNSSILFLFWVTAMLFSLYNTKFPVSGSLIIVSYVLLFMLSFVLFPNSFVKEDYLNFQLVVFWSILITLIVSILLSLGDTNSFYIVGTRVRYQAIFKKPNYLALFSFTGFMVSLAVFALNTKKKYLVFTPFYLVLIYISNTRAPLLAIGVFFILLFYLLIYSKIINRHKKMMINAFLLSTFGIVIIWLVYKATYNNFVFQSISVFNKISSNRLNLWIQALSSIKSYWELFFGVGLGSAHLSSLSYDNSYLNILLQTGLCGLLLFFVFIVYILRWFVLEFNRYYFYPLFLIQFSMFLAFLFYSFNESILFTVGNISSIYIWMSIGFLINNAHIYLRRKDEKGNLKNYGYGVQKNN